MNNSPTNVEPLRIGVVDTGINPWHSHVLGKVTGCRIFVDDDGYIREDEDFRDNVGHGTAVAGILREALYDAELFAVRVFDDELRTFPSLVARGVLRAASQGCRVINLSLALPAEFGGESLAEACAAAIKAGSVLVAAGKPGTPDLLPASLPGVHGVIEGEGMRPGEVRLDAEGPYRCRAPGVPRALEAAPPSGNLWGHSFACARVSAHLAAELKS